MHHISVAEWAEVVMRQLPSLSKPQAMGLALWSFGMVMSQSCGLTTVSMFLAELMGKKENTMRQRLREWYYPKTPKRGKKRQELRVSGCFADLLRWVLRYWQSEEKRLALALDATTLGERFTVLAVGVMYRSSAVYVAWVVLPANTPGSWRQPWLKLLACLGEAVPADWTVIVLADRGLYAPWLYQAIKQQGWHPYLRLRANGQVQTKSSKRFKPLRVLAPSVGSVYAARVTCFKSKPLNCTLLVRWDKPHEDAWFIVTDLAPEHADALWYGLRAWIEQGFKHTKRAGWHWQATRMHDPERANRLWLAMAVAHLWVLAVGSEAEDNQTDANQTDVNKTLSFSSPLMTYPTRRSPCAARLIGCFRRGILTILATLLNALPLPLGYLRPQPWPQQSLASGLPASTLAPLALAA